MVIVRGITLAFILCMLACSPLPTAEPHAKEVVDIIEQTRLFVQKFARHGNHPCAEQKCVFLSFWDFDGTIIHGDITDGLTDENGELVYKGLQQVAIEAGLSGRYLGDDGFTRYRRDYEALESGAGHEPAYRFIPQAFAGAHPREFEELVERHFDETLSRYFFSASVAMLEHLREHGVETHIVSASPHFFVRGAAKSLDLPEAWIHGVRLETDANGSLSSRVAEPFPYAAGKTAVIQHVVAETKEREGTEHVYVIAGFGNSPHTDGHFLEFVARQRLPDGRPLAVMINGGEEVNENFHYVTQREVMSQRTD